MTEFIKNLVSTVFKDNVWLGVMLIAAIPIIELKGAIPFAMTEAIWGANALNVYQAFLFSYIGSVIPAFLIIFFLTPVFKWLKKFKFFKKMVDFFEERFKRLAEKIKSKSNSEPAGIKEELPSEDGSAATAASTAASKGQTPPSLNSESSDAKQELSEGIITPEEAARRKKTEWIKFFGVMIFAAIPLPLTGVWTSSAIAVFLGMKRRHSLPAVLIGNFIAGIFISLVCLIFDSYLAVFYIIVAIFLAAFLFGIIRSIIKKRVKKA